MNLDVGKTITVYASNLIEHYPLIQRSNGITMSSQVRKYIYQILDEYDIYLRKT